jgi:general secretion pathway protein H
MVALTIVALLFSAVAVGLGAITGAKARTATGELAGVIRSLYDTAALSGRTCRLAFQLPGEKDEDASVVYRAECAASGITASRDREGELRQEGEEERERARHGPSLREEFAEEEERVDSAAKFSEFTSSEVEPRTLPSAVRLSVWTKQQRQAVKSGPAYLYFFPQGFTERAMVFVRQGSSVWTISVAPLTGKAKIVSEELEIPRS